MARGPMKRAGRYYMGEWVLVSVLKGTLACRYARPLAAGSRTPAYLFRLSFALLCFCFSLLPPHVFILHDAIDLYNMILTFVFSFLTRIDYPGMGGGVGFDPHSTESFAAVTQNNLSLAHTQSRPMYSTSLPLDAARDAHSDYRMNVLTTLQESQRQAPFGGAGGRRQSSGLIQSSQRRVREEMHRSGVEALKPVAATTDSNR